MPRYEYKVVPAPTKGLKGKGVKGPEARFSNAIQQLMNTQAEEGWEYQRAETLPSIERSGLTSSTTEWRNVLIFRRARQDDTEAFAPELLPPPPVVPLPVETAAQEQPEEPKEAEPEDSVEPPSKNTSPAEGEDDAAAPDFSKWDNGVEDTGDIKGVGPTLETLAATRNTSKTDS